MAESGPGEIDQNSADAVLTLRAPAASRTLARIDSDHPWSSTS